MQVKKQQLEPDMEQCIGSNWESCILSPCLFNFYAEHSKWNPGLDESQTGNRIAGGSNNSRYTNTTLMAENKMELESLLMKVKEESEKAGLKLNIKKPVMMAFSPITSWQIEVGKVKAVTDFLFLGSKITVDSDCSHKFKRPSLLERKPMTNLLWFNMLYNQHIKKQTHTPHPHTK